MNDTLDYVKPQPSQTPWLRWFWNIGVDFVAAVFGLGGYGVAWMRGFDGMLGFVSSSAACLAVFWITGWLILQVVLAGTSYVRPSSVPIHHNPFRCLLWRVPLTAAVWLAALQIPKWCC